MLKNLFLTIAFLVSFCVGLRANPNSIPSKYSLKGVVEGAEGSLPFAAVSLYGLGKTYDTICNEHGEFAFSGLEAGDYTIKASYVAYEFYSARLSVNQNIKGLRIGLKWSAQNIQEVVVTGVESKGITTSTTINREAIELLQPSSFSDILELLPGGNSSPPSLTTANTITLREVGISGDDYNTSAMGTAFVVDGARISNTANMQYTSGPDYIIGSSGYTDAERSTVNNGIDMRSISTDQIDKVEIIRGIPSVRYGSLTSGLVNITRKIGATPLNARFKADAVSKLLAASKGYSIGNNKFAVSLDYLDSKSTPTNDFENYQRVTASLRYAKETEKSKFRTNLDYSSNIDKVSTDPDTGLIYDDTYKSSYNRFAWSNGYELKFGDNFFLDNISLRADLSYELDEIHQTRFVELNKPSYVPNFTESGVYEGEYLPAKWHSDLLVEGRPLSIFTSINTDASFSTFGVTHKVVAGAEWAFDKNFGDGQVYDVNLPPSAEMSSRPRKYSDIPASSELSFFVEDALSKAFGEHRMTVIGGLRSSSLLGLEDEYEMAGKMYFDPRVNAKWQFPSIFISQKPLKLSLRGGWGRQSMKPSLLQMYPDWVYTDYEQLNYYHTNPDYRLISVKTYKEEVINYELEPAINDKWELNLSASYNSHFFTVTYFRERMDNAFRSEVNRIVNHTYYEYDPLSIDASALTEKPSLSDFSYTEQNYVRAYSAASNGSLIDKEGLEFSYSSRRIPQINTRITFNGAWFRTIYDNTLPIYRSSSKTVDGEQIKEIGIYESDGGYWREQLNTNLMLDAYVPALDLKLFASFQTTWFYSKQTTPYSGVPFAYVDTEGVTRPYTQSEQEDYRLQHLVLSVNDSAFDKQTTPFGMDVNLKLSKHFGEMMLVSVFVNNLFSYYPDYEVNGVTIKRNSTPYFGAEITLKL